MTLNENIISNGLTIPKNNNNNTENQTQHSSQAWIGTSYSCVLVLNSLTYMSSNSKTSSSIAGSNSALTAADSEFGTVTNPANLKQTFITPSGNIHQLKGEIIDISFLDASGNLITFNENHKPKMKATAPGSSATAPQNTDLFDLESDLEFSYSSNAFSNSIADQFNAVPSPTTLNNSSTLITATGSNDFSNNTSVNTTSQASTPTIVVAPEESKLLKANKSKE
jgi:hypothetical protein